MTYSPRRGRGMIVIAAAIAIGGSGCTSGPHAAETSAPATTHPAVADVLEAFDGVGYDYDYDPSATPEDLSEGRDVVVVGTVEAVSEGRTSVIVGTDEPVDATIVVTLSNAEHLIGAAPSDGDGHVYIELPDPGLQDTTAYEKALPKGAPVLVYGDDAWDGAPGDGDIELRDPAGGRPDGQHLYMPAGPQGFLVQAAAEQVVWPLLAETAPGTLAEAEPEGRLIAE